MRAILLKPMARVLFKAKRRQLFVKPDAVQASAPFVVLIFGPFDPTGASSLPGDAVTFAALGGHAISALTATLVKDTATTEDIQAAAPEFLNDQARCMLEDMTVSAIKVGPVYTTETVSVIAQIAADYSDLPLVLQPGQLPYESIADDIDAEDAQLALFELLLPQTDIVVVTDNLLTHWVTQGLLADASSDDPAQALLEYGAKWVLTCGAAIRTGQTGYVLRSRNHTHTWTHTPPPARLQDPEGPLTCAITAALAAGHDVPQAVEHALSQARHLTENSFQPGMGQLLINRIAFIQPGR